MKVLCLILVCFPLFWETEQQACHTGQLDICLAPSLLAGRRNLVPIGEKALNTRCRMWNDMWKCVDDFTGKCFADAHRFFFKFAVQRKRSLTSELCDSNTEFRRDFLKYAPCLTDVTKAAREYCMENLESMIYMMTGDNVEERIPAGCCFFQRFYNCFNQHVKKTCEKESYEFINKASEMMCIDNLNSICNGYDPDSPQCADLLSRNVTSPSEESSYIARLMVLFWKH